MGNTLIVHESHALSPLFKNRAQLHNIMYLLNTFVLMVILLNILIAILSNIFAEI